MARRLSPLSIARFFSGSQRRLGRRQTRDWDTKRRTTDIVQSNLVAERDRTRIAAMFAANSDFKVRLYTPTSLGAGANQLAHPFSIEHLKWIFRQNLAFDIRWQEAAGVVSTQSKSGLG